MIDSNDNDSTQLSTLSLDPTKWQGMQVLGERFQPRLDPVEVPFETAFITSERPLPGVIPPDYVPDLQIAFSGFNQLQSNPETYLILSAALPEKPVDFAFCGVGVLIIQASMFDEFASMWQRGWSPTVEELKLMANFLEVLVRKKWQLRGTPLAVNFGKVTEGGLLVKPTEVELYFQLTAGTTKQAYLDRVQILTQDLELANRHLVMSSLGGAMKDVGKDSSNDPTPTKH